jgi:hypothetical protein
MRKAKITLFLMLLVLAFSLMNNGAGASERNIYVGDIIELKISSQGLTEDVIREGFGAFEIVELVKEYDSFLIKLRTFETGEKRVILGDKEIVIVVSSTLEDIQSEGAMEGDLGPETLGFVMPWRYLFYALLAAFIVTGVFYLKGCFHNKSLAKLTPYQRFLHQSEGVLLTDDEYFVKLTCFLKEYLGIAYNCTIIGKTTTELLLITDRLPRMQNVRVELGHWLRESDFIKFTGADTSNEKKKEMLGRLVDVVGRIEAEKGAMS